MTTPYVDPQTVHNPTTGGSPPASWGDTVRDNQQLFSTPPSVKAVRTASQSIANNTATAIAFTAADEWDTDSFHSTTVNNTRITVPAGLGGKYLLIGSMNMTPGTSSIRYLELKLNGTTRIEIFQVNGQSSYTVFQPTVLTSLAAGDYVEAYAFQDSGTAQTVIGTFSAHWVSL